MEIAEKITLAAAILWIIWQFFSLITTPRRFSVFFLSDIIWLPIFTVLTIAIVLLHQSVFHLIWLWILSFILGILTTMSPWCQRIALEIFVVLSLINSSDEFEEDNDEQDEFFQEEGDHRSKLVAMQPLFKGMKKDKPQGFG